MGKLISRFLLWISGWHADLNIPDECDRCVMIAAPHTSNWDAYYIRLAATVMGIPVKVGIKDTWTKGIVGPFIRSMGGLGINRSPKEGTNRLSQTQVMAQLFDTKEKIALAIAPEGTRKKRERWKMGFYWVAHEANVPIAMGYLDYKRKVAGVHHEVVYTTGDIDKDMKLINNFYRGISGKFPEHFSVDLRYEEGSTTS